MYCVLVIYQTSLITLLWMFCSKQWYWCRRGLVSATHDHPPTPQTVSTLAEPIYYNVIHSSSATNWNLKLPTSLANIGADDELDEFYNLTNFAVVLGDHLWTRPGAAVVVEQLAPPLKKRRGGGVGGCFEWTDWLRNIRPETLTRVGAAALWVSTALARPGASHQHLCLRVKYL